MNRQVELEFPTPIVDHRLATAACAARSVVAVGRQAGARSGKVFVFVAVSLPALLGIVGLVFDTGLIMSDRENLQHGTDAAATAAAMDLLENKSNATAVATAASYLQTLNGFADAQITTNIPPSSGPYTGKTGFVEVIATRQHPTAIMQMVGAALQSPITARAVAGFQPSTAGAAVIVLDPSPPSLQVNAMLPTLASYPALLGGLEMPGAGAVQVNGAVLVNTTWGGVDQNGNPAGTGSGPPWGIACTYALPLSQLKATDIRVVGGVDDQNNYANYTQGQPSPLRANALPVSDPFDQLPVPSLATDSVNVSTTTYGGVQVVQLPLIVTPKVLNPGVYDWIEVDSGNVVFTPGIYIIRSVNPSSGIGLNIAGGIVTANGVLFYITNSTSFDPATGAPDSGDGDTQPAAPGTSALSPSVLINAALPGTSFSPLGAGSPFSGMMIYQRRQDYRPIVVVYQALLGSAAFQGIVYAKWGHFLFAGDGTLNMSIVAGTARLVPVLGLTIQPVSLLPPANDVYLVE